MIYQKLASAIYNDVMTGLRGASSGQAMSMEQLEDDIIDERLQILKEYTIKGLLPKQDLLLSINCVQVDCESLERCPCNDVGNKIAHIQIPQLVNDFGTDNALEYIGSPDRQNPFIVYTSINELIAHKYRKRGKNKPYVFVDITPNKNNMNDCFIFNAPMISTLAVVGIFKDPRQLEFYGCCDHLLDEEIDNLSAINNEIKRRLTEKKLRFYRQLAIPLHPNNQTPD